MKDYLKKLKKLSSDISKIHKLATENSINSIANKALAVKDRIDKNNFIITVVGEFNRGKSTFINSLLGVDIIPTAIRPTTATINIIHYATSPSVRVHKSDGEIISLEFSSTSLMDYTSLVDFDSKSVKYIEIAYPIDYLKDGTTFVDTPGVNDMDQQRRDVTYGYMPNSDAVIFLFDIEAPFRKSEKKFLEERVLKSNVAQLFFVANKCDRLDDDEIDHSINEINKNLSYLYPEHEFEVYPLSARNALKMRLENNESGVSRNLFKDFEDKIKTFIQGSEKIELKFKMFETQYNELVKQFSEEIDIQLNILDLSVGELENTKKLIKQSEGKFYKAFEKLLKYIDQQNLALKQRIESSLIKDYKNKEEAFIHEIDLQKGNIKEYAEKHLNYNVEKSMKTWVEQSQPFIDQNIKAIISKVLDGYRKYFSKTPIINSLHNNSLTPSSSNSIQKIELTEDYNIENISKGSMAAGAIVLGGMAIMTGGLSLAALIPAYAGGSISKNLVGGHFSKKQIETQKKELLIILPEILAKAYESLRKNTLQTLDNSIIEVKTSLNNDFNRTIEDIKETIENNINEKNKDQAGNYRKIKHLKEIFNLINKKKIYEF